MVTDVNTELPVHDAQFADQGYLEVDGSYEWDNDYPNPVRESPSLSLLPLTSSAQCMMLTSSPCSATLHVGSSSLSRHAAVLSLRSPTQPPTKSSVTRASSPSNSTTSCTRCAEAHALYAACACLQPRIWEKTWSKPAQNWITYGAGFNTTTAMLADVKANPGYSLAMHNGAMAFGLRRLSRVSTSHMSLRKGDDLGAADTVCQLLPVILLVTVPTASLQPLLARQATSATRKGSRTGGISTGRTSSRCTPRSRTPPRSGECRPPACLDVPIRFGNRAVFIHGNLLEG